MQWLILLSIGEGWGFRTDPNAYRLSDCVKGFLLQTPPNKSLCAEYKAQSKEFTQFVSKYITPQPKLVLHVRLGDVIERAPQSASDFWNGVTNQSSVRSKLHAKYVRSKDYYARIFSRIQTSLPVHIYGSFCHNTKRRLKQEQYLAHLKYFIKKKNFRVIDKIERRCSQVTFKDVDKDFIDMASALLFIPSGGGFSKLIASVVKLNGVVL